MMMVHVIMMIEIVNCATISALRTGKLRLAILISFFKASAGVTRATRNAGYNEAITPVPTVSKTIPDIQLTPRSENCNAFPVNWLAKGSMPLQNLRANLDYGEGTAFNSYGTVGINVWIYKGEIFNKK